MKIALTDEGFMAIDRKKTRSIAFGEITGIAAEKIGKITYDEVFLIILDGSGNELALGELDDGFADVERALRTQLPDFPADWWAKAEASPIGIRTDVWTPVSTKPT